MIKCNRGVFLFYFHDLKYIQNIYLKNFTSFLSINVDFYYWNCIEKKYFSPSADVWSLMFEIFESRISWANYLLRLISIDRVFLLGVFCQLQKKKNCRNNSYKAKLNYSDTPNLR